MMTQYPIPKVLRQGAGRLWSGISRLHRAVRSSRCQGKELPILVVGSLRAGGSGKTDWVDWIARRHSRLAILVHPTGDEDVWLRRRHPERVFVHRDFLVAWSRARNAGFRAAVSDGGLQDPGLDGGTAILLGDSRVAEGFSDLHPFGPYREVAPSRRVDLHLVEGNGWAWIHRLEDLQGAVHPAPGRRRVLCAAGVARIDKFCQDAERLGVEVAGVLPTRDHGSFSSREVSRLERTHPDAVWLISAKDEARGEVAKFALPVFVLRRELSVSEAVGQSIDALALDLVLHPGVSG